MRTGKRKRSGARAGPRECVYTTGPGTGRLTLWTNGGRLNRGDLRELLLAIRHLRLEAHEDRAVHLADAGFGEVERRADLLHGHLLEVVEYDDQALGAGEALGDQLLEVLVLYLTDGVGAALVLKHVDLAHVLVAVGLEPLAGEGDDADGAGVLSHLLELAHRDLQALGDLVVRRSAPQ